MVCHCEPLGVTSNLVTTDADMVVRPTLAEVVTRRREELGLTKSDLARRAGVTRSTIHEIENGARHKLQPATYRHLDSALQWDPGTLQRMTTTTMLLETKSMVAQIQSRLAPIQASRVEALAELLLEVGRRLDSLEEKLTYGDSDRPTGGVVNGVR